MVNSSLHVTALPGPFGATVDGIDLRALDDDMMRELIAAFYHHRVMIVRGQQLQSADYVRFGRYWGQPLRFFIANHRDDEFPEIIRIDNAPDKPEHQRDGAAHWHSDSSYEAVPASVTMIYALQAPRVGGDTLFADTVAAYAALPEETRELIDTLQVRHALCAAPPLDEETLHVQAHSRDNAVVHPLVMRHPVTGENALFLSGTAFEIIGWDEPGSTAFIRELRAHAVHERFRLRCKAEAGDILLWDNFAVMHSATPLEYSSEDGKRRLLHRISTKGLPALLATT
jgi:taurine dioxygenase